MKCRVLSKCTITVNPGSVVDVDDRQFELARSVLAPADRDVSVAQVETATKKPRKKKTEE